MTPLLRTVELGGEGVNEVTPADIENIDLPNINESYNEEVDELAVTGNIVSYFTYIFPFFTFFIKNPPKCASPYHYLQANFDTLKSEIETSEPFSLTHGHSLKIWITAWSYYVKLDRGLDGGMLNLVHAYRCGMVQNTVIHTTAYRLGFNTGKLSKKKFKKVINLVGSGFSGNEDCLNQSGWSYYKTVYILICFAVISGKDMARTKPLQPIRQWVKYPPGFCGCKSVVNINYEKLIDDMNDVAFTKGRGSPCVKFALKVHLINTSKTLPAADRVFAMAELTVKHTTRITPRTVDILNRQDLGSLFTC